jgi:uncharacterized cofD-like protein
LREEQNGNLSRVRGESRIPGAQGAIERVFLEPENAPAYPEAVRAILSADIVLAGPGSLYTSVLPNLLVPGIANAVRASRALKIYVCNVATQIGETDHYTVDDHVLALDAHLGPGVFPIVLANDNLDVGCELPEGVEMVTLDFNHSPVRAFRRAFAANSLTCRRVTTDLLTPDCPWRHDPERLSRAILGLYQAERL